jgi:hypothetical protein
MAFCGVIDFAPRHGDVILGEGAETSGPLSHEEPVPALRYTSRIVPVSSLSSAVKRQMARLYLASYDATSESLFLHDLDAKDEALLVNAGDELVGFTTLRVFERRWQGDSLRIVYSGDTVVDQRHWGQQTLAFAWIEHAGQLRRERPECPLFWFLLVKGHRTFRYLPAFAKSFYPHWAQHDDRLKKLADALALEMFPNDYNPSTGVVEFELSRGQLKSYIAEPADMARARKDVQFFLARNPGYVRGHELVCLCELDDRNLKPLARRLFEKQAHVG